VQERDAALAEVEQLAGGCDTAADLGTENGLSDLFTVVGGDVERVIREVHSEKPIPALAQIVAAGADGIPVPKAFTLGLSQVVTGGQPGFAVSGAGTLNPTAKDPFLRHVGVNASGLIVLPALPSSSGSTSPPQLGPLTLSAGYDSRKGANDIYRSLDPQKVSHIRKLAGSSALRRFLQDWVSRPENERRTQSRIEEITIDATKQFVDTFDSELKPEISKVAEEVAFATVGLNVRYLHQPKFVPEFSELLSAGLDASLEAGTDNQPASLNVRFTGALSAHFSAFPKELCADGPDTVTADDPPIRTCRAQPAFASDLRLGLVFGIPTTGTNGQVQLRLVGLMRLRTPGVVSGADVSVGGGGTIVVPVALETSLVGSVTTRWTIGVDHPDVTAGFSFARSL
jgi:hypothetical protein